MALRLLLLLLVAAPAAAQPAADAVVDAWLAGWRRAAADVEAIDATERAVWTVDGPRGQTAVDAEGAIRYVGGNPPERDLRRIRVNGREVAPERGHGQGRRWQRAFGPAGREVHAPPRLPAQVLRGARPLGLTPDRLDGVPAWRVELDTRADRAEAWFTRSETPRLLAVRFEGQRPRGGRLVREVRYVRVGGLDLPAEARTTFTARQRRRLREYFVTLSAVGIYSDHSLR